MKTGWYCENTALVLGHYKQGMGNMDEKFKAFEMRYLKKKTDGRKRYICRNGRSRIEAHPYWTRVEGYNLQNIMAYDLN